MRRFHAAVLIFSIVATQVPVYAESSFTPIQASPMDSQSTSRPVGPSSPLDTSRPGYNPNVFNPAMGLILDAIVGDTRERRGFFDFRSAELNLMAAVDPFANLYAVINGTDEGLEVEEAAFLTTSLPYNLTVRGGRFFANFGRFPHWHDHELPFVNRTPSLDTFVDGEAKADGAELIHLFKTPFFLQGTLGAYTKIGAENERLKEVDPATGGLDFAGHSNGRPWSADTYLQRLFTNVEFSDLTNMDIGISNAVTPRQYYVGGIRREDPAPRWLSGVDLTFRYEPTGAGQVGRLLWGTEIFRNDERRLQPLALDTDLDGVGDTDTFDRQHALGGYSYMDWRFARRFSGGGFFDLAQNLDSRRANTNTYGITLNFLPSEFQRIRLQLSQAKVNDGSKTDNQVFVQWFGTIGTHVHVFKDR
jgi:hypothetical protein